MHICQQGILQNKHDPSWTPSFRQSIQVMVVLQWKIRDICCQGKGWNIKGRILLDSRIFRQRPQGNGIFFPALRLTGPEGRNTDPSNTTFTVLVILPDLPDEKSPTIRYDWRIIVPCMLLIMWGVCLTAFIDQPPPLSVQLSGINLIAALTSPHSSAR